MLRAWAIVLAAAAAQFTAGVTGVEVYVTVTDDSGTSVRGLTREAFEVYENNVRQDVTAFAAGDFPLSVGVALDRSFSMAGDPLRLATAAARSFAGHVRPTDQLMLTAIGSEVEVLAPLSADRTIFLEALGALKPWGTTSLHDAIIRAIDLLASGRGRRALIVLSDGADRYSDATAADVLDHARGSDVLIYPVALGKTRPALFAELAVLTGGRSFQLRSPRELEATFTTIAEELRNQYMLGYTPSRAADPEHPEWRPIKVVVKRAGVRVRARDGYVAR